MKADLTGATSNTTEPQTYEFDFSKVPEGVLTQLVFAAMAVGVAWDSGKIDLTGQPQDAADDVGKVLAELSVAVTRLEAFAIPPKS